MLRLKEMKSSNKPWLNKAILKLINQKKKKKSYLQEINRAKNLHFKELYHLEFKRYQV